MSLQNLDLEYPCISLLIVLTSFNTQKLTQMSLLQKRVESLLRRIKRTLDRPTANHLTISTQAYIDRFLKKEEDVVNADLLYL